MMKFCLAAVLTLGLSGCMGSGTPQNSAAALDTHSASCANPNMGTANGLPMRCGPQVAKPYSYQ